jgi:hypothetical protein
MNRLLICVVVAQMLLFVCVKEQSPAQTGEVSSDELSGVVEAIERKMKVKQETQPAIDEGELTGVVVTDPCETATGVSQFRLCTDSGKFVNVCMPLTPNALKDFGCNSDQRIAIDSCSETFSGCVVAPSKSIKAAGPCPVGVPLICTLQNAVKSGTVSCGGLVGDGKTTSQCEMPCTNKTDKPVNVCVPQNQCFKPDQPDCQTMMCTKDTCVEIPPRKTVTCVLPTMCISPHSSNPPPKKRRQYEPVPFDNCEFYKLCDHLLTLSKYLEEEHYYDQVPIPAERRKETICQLAQWIEQGNRSGLSKDVISPESVRHDLLERGNVKLQSLSAEDVAKLDGYCQKIYNAAQLTWKLAGNKRIDAVIAGTTSTN